MRSRSPNDTQYPKYGYSKILFMDLNNSLCMQQLSMEKWIYWRHCLKYHGRTKERFSYSVGSINLVEGMECSSHVVSVMKEAGKHCIHLLEGEITFFWDYFLEKMALEWDVRSPTRLSVEDACFRWNKIMKLRWGGRTWGVFYICWVRKLKKII